MARKIAEQDQPKTILAWLAQRGVEGGVIPGAFTIYRLPCDCGRPKCLRLLETRGVYRVLWECRKVNEKVSNLEDLCRILEQ